MSLALDDLPRDPEWLLQQLQRMHEVVAAKHSRISALEIERDTVGSVHERGGNSAPVRVRGEVAIGPVG
jgi:hypothetical protein